MEKLRNEKDTTNSENAKSGVTVICLIKGSNRKYLLRSNLTESTSEMTYLKE